MNKVQIEVADTLAQDMRRPLDPLATELESNPELGCQLVIVMIFDTKTRTY